MNRIILNNAARLEMQGQEVMHLIHLDDVKAVYKLVVFSSPAIILTDFRQSGLNAIKQVIATGRKDEFSYQFNIPSHVIMEVNTHQVQIELRDTDEQNPEYLLWVSIGYRGRLPMYDYLYKEIVNLTDTGNLALIALYRQPRKHSKMHPLYSELVR